MNNDHIVETYNPGKEVFEERFKHTIRGKQQPVFCP